MVDESSGRSTFPVKDLRLSGMVVFTIRRRLGRSWKGEDGRTVSDD